MNDPDSFAIILFASCCHLISQDATCSVYFDSFNAISSVAVMLQKTSVARGGRCFSNIIARWKNFIVCPLDKVLSVVIGVKSCQSFNFRSRCRLQPFNSHCASSHQGSFLMPFMYSSQHL